MSADVHELNAKPEQQTTPETSGAGGCRTAPLVASFSTCLVEDPLCEYALPFGFSILCTHPRHLDFIDSSAALPDKDMQSESRKRRNRRGTH